jgi:apolipoprotein N-acyltransferase
MLGCLTILAFPPINLFLVIFWTIPSLFKLTNSATSKKDAFLYGWFFGLGYYIFGLYWVSIALFVDLPRFFWLLPATGLLIPGILAIYFGLTTLLTYLIPARNKAILFALIWFLMEYARGHLFTGFPWILIGYIWSFSDRMLQIASIIGIYGLSLLTVLLASLFAVRYYKTTLLFMVAMFIFGSIRLEQAKEPDTGTTLKIVQANIKQDIKWHPKKMFSNLTKYIELSESSEDVDYTIWPESAIPYPINNPELLRYLTRAISEDGLLLTGSVTYQKPQWFNSLTAINKQGEIIASYHKTHLLPFGEYVPFRKFLPITKITQGTEDISHGIGYEVVTLPKTSFMPMICYEIIFPDEANSRGASWILNVTNDAWYGTSTGPYQHLHMSRFRAVEQGLPLVRSAGTGISAIVDAYGRIRATIPLNKQDVLISKLPAPAKNPTIYGRYGECVTLLMFVAVALTALYKNLRKY